MNIPGQSYEGIQRDLLQLLLSAPEVAPRGQRVRELLGVTLRLDDPRARLTFSPARAANYGFAAGEFLWYLRGAEDLSSIAYYNKRMSAFSDDGKKLHSAYGRRLRSALPGRPSQWQDVLDELRADPASRRAVMTIYAPSDMRRARTEGTKDVPCTLAVQAFIRDGKLTWHVTMRSNDAVWGLANDLFSFTLLQEVMALDLGVPLGVYLHTAGSMHLYERHYDLATAVAAEDVGGYMQMSPLVGDADLEILQRIEVRLREGQSVKALTKAIPADSGERWLLDRLVEHRAKRDGEVTS